MDKKVINVLKKAKSVHELISLAKSQHLDLSFKEAEELYSEFNPVELSDGEVEAVAGGKSIIIHN